MPILTTFTRATQTLTFTGAATHGETVRIGRQDYTFVTTLSNVAGLVAYGTTEECVDNLVAAINKAAGGGTTYADDTPVNPSVTAVKSGTTMVVVTAKAPGLEGNGIITSESVTNASWASPASQLNDGAAAFNTIRDEISAFLEATREDMPFGVNSAILDRLSRLEVELDAL